MTGSLAASVVIPSFNGGRTLGACLDGFAAQSPKTEPFELIVVLDGSTDGSKAYLANRRGLPFELIVIEQPNRGRAAALNAGIRRARAPVILVTDDDIRVSPEFVLGHLRALRTADAVVGPIPLDPGGPVDFLTEPVRLWGEALEQELAESGGPRRFDQVQGANISFRKAPFLKLGGYQEALRRTQDWELGWRMLQAGWRIGFCREARAAQRFEKTIPEIFNDTYRDGYAHAQLIGLHPALGECLRAGQVGADPGTLVKRWLRPRIVGRKLTGRVILAVAAHLSEWARRAGCRGTFWRDFSGVMRDGLYFRGVSDHAAHLPPILYWFTGN